jgi:hypothetical protein
VTHWTHFHLLSLLKAATFWFVINASLVDSNAPAVAPQNWHQLFEVR